MKQHQSYLFLLVVSLLAVFLYSCGSAVYITEGNLDFLQNQKVIKVKYQYDGMTVGKYTEAEYTQKEIQRLNAKEPGRGDSWIKSWRLDRTTLFQPKFEELINKRLLGRLEIKPDADNAQYTMTVKTVSTESGYNAGISAKAASIDVVILFTETNNSEKVVASLELDDIKASTFWTGTEFATGPRIAQAYAECGKTLGTFLEKNL
jgi:hypothetical protein